MRYTRFYKAYKNLRQFAFAMLMMACLAACGISRSAAQGNEPLRMVVVGDSVMWGQGLETKDKFYRKAADWLEATYGRSVEVYLFAHSGAVIQSLSQETDPLWGEVPRSYPSITKQVCEMVPLDIRNQVDLVLLDGGINDVGVTRLLNPDPTVSEDTIRTWTQRECIERMRGLLRLVAAKFPSAKVIVTNYYPIISQFTVVNHLTTLLDLFNFQFFGLTIELIMGNLASKSVAWADESINGLQQVVDEMNGAFQTRRFQLARCGIGAGDCFGTIGTSLWLGVDDPLYDERHDWYEENSNIDDVPFYMPFASVGHPNVQGSQKYADAIIAALRKFSFSDLYVDGAYTGEEYGTAQQPFKTVAKAVQAAVYGRPQTIYVKAFNYNETVRTDRKTLRLVNWDNSGLVRIGAP